MINVKENFQLKDYNTFRVSAKCNFFIEFNSLSDIPIILKENKFKNLPYFVLGGGSNVLFTRDFKGVIYYPDIKGIKIIKETKQHIYIKSGAGENWDSFVGYCVKNNYQGIENLSLIPGNVGATPVQNIGAYGVEVKDFIEKVTAFNIDKEEIVQFSNPECNFSYRNSVFKNQFKNQYIITHVTFKLNKTHNYITHYGNVADELTRFKSIDLKNIREAIINIRERKLPDYKEIGNAGSFFKNTIVSNDIIETLKQKYPDIPVYPVDNSTSKLAAGWLIDMCGWKGKQYKNTGTYKKQALVLLNYGNSTGKEIEELSYLIIKDVYKKFRIKISTEVTIL